MGSKQSFSLLAVFLIALAGCGGSGHSPEELSTAAQAHAFVAAIARGGSQATWHLASDAQPQAKRAWAERAAIREFAARIRAIRSYWACDLVEDAAQIGFGSVGFNANDRRGVTRIALNKGASMAQVGPLIADVEKIANPDLKTVSAALCG